MFCCVGLHAAEGRVAERTDHRGGEEVYIAGLKSEHHMAYSGKLGLSSFVFVNCSFMAACHWRLLEDFLLMGI